jgi:hypothetical protein
VRPCNLAGRYQHFLGACIFRLQDTWETSSILKIQAYRSCNSAVPIYITTQRNNPQYVALNLNSVETPNLTTLLYLHALRLSQLRRIFNPKVQALIQ